MKRCVIFDLDGTLADTSGDLIAAANAAFAHLGRDVRLDASRAADRAQAVRGGRSMLRLGLARLGPVDEAEVDRGYQPLLDAYDTDIASRTTFYPGALDAVRRLRARGDATGICTNKPEALAVKLMAAMGASDLFDALIGADTLAVRKPDPAPLLEAVARAGGDPARACLVGDTVTDRDAARAAGVPCILMAFAQDRAALGELEPAALLDGYDDLESAVDHAWRGGPSVGRYARRTRLSERRRRFMSPRRNASLRMPRVSRNRDAVRSHGSRKRDSRQAERYAARSRSARYASRARATG